jgi:hypothetical protein
MPIVEVNGQEIEFPDTMSGDEIKAVLREKFPMQGGEQTPAREKVGLGRTILDQGLQGATLGFSDEITDRMGAGIASVVTGQPYKELLPEARRTTQEMYERQTKDRPITSIASNVMGGLASGGAGAATKVGGALGQAIRSGGVGARIAKGVATGGLSGAIYGAGVGEDDKKLESAISSGAMGAAVGGGLPAAGALVGGVAKGTKNMIKGARARGEDVLDVALGQIKDRGRKLYEVVDNSGAKFSDDSANKLLGSLGRVVRNEDKASSKLYKSTLLAIDDLSQDILDGNTSLATLDRHRQILGNIGKDIVNPNKAQEAKAASDAIDLIDDFVINADIGAVDDYAKEALQSARKVWSQSKKFEKVSHLINKAGGDANKLKRDLWNFRMNKKNTVGWTQDEIDALKFASSQTTGESLLKMAGKFGFDLGSGVSVGNTALPVLGGVGAGATCGAGVGAVVPVAGTIARSAHKAVSAGKAESLLRLIEDGAKVSNQMVNKLPPKERDKFLKSISKMSASKVVKSLGGKGKK